MPSKKFAIVPGGTLTGDRASSGGPAWGALPDVRGLMSGGLPVPGMAECTVEAAAEGRLGARGVLDDDVPGAGLPM
jgi:hypothetical protein